MFEEGDILTTKNSERYTNAILVRTTGDSYIVLSDWGNLMTFTLDSLNEAFYVSDSFKEYKMYGYPYGTVQERLQEQIDKLKESQKTLTELGVT